MCSEFLENHWSDSHTSKVGATAGAVSGGAAGYGAYAKKDEIQVLVGVGGRGDGMHLQSVI